MTEPKDGLEANLQGAADLLRGLPREAPPASVSPVVVEKVRPEAEKRRRLMTGIVVLLVLMGLLYGASLAGLLSAEGT